MTIKEAIDETGMSRTTIRGWVRDGLEHQRVQGKLYVAEGKLFERLRVSLQADTRAKTRWTNRQRD